ncbi:hypothetical protein C4K01_4422 [Pseudomonas synxantha]|nr:hypothetical protein C4K01_4422 [Pseudomonas synxantha]
MIPWGGGAGHCRVTTPMYVGSPSLWRGPVTECIARHMPWAGGWVLPSAFHHD